MVNALALATSVACLFVLFTSGAAAVTLPAGFAETTVLPGVGKPQDIAIAPNGRVFVAEKTGFIRTYDSVDDTTPTLFADLRTQVHNYGSRGLLSIVTDPGFPGKPYVYVYYTMDAPLGAAPAVYGGGSFDACPKFFDPQDGDLDRAGMQTIGEVDNCPVGSRISRLQVAGELMTGSEKILVEDFCQQFAGHAGGGLAFDKDGKLIASASDGSTSQFWDWGQSGSPANPCNDPPGGVGASLTRPTSEGGRFRAQDIRTTSDPLGLSGSVIRIDPATGAPVGTSGADTNAKRIIAYGLRDASRLAVRPGTNDIWVTDRGGGYWEEFHRVTPGSSKPNFGWPCYENNAKREQSDLQNLNLCESLYSGGGATSAFWAYDHELDVHPDDNCVANDERSGSTLSGLEFYPVAGNFPPLYRNALFFADRLRSCIWALLPDTTGIPKKGNVVPFAGMANRATDLEATAQGDLLYIDQSVDTIRRIRYTPPNNPPTAVATANVTSGNAPLAVTFSALGSTDPDAGDTLTYAWDLDGDSLLDDSTAAQPSFNYTTPGSRTVTLKVTDPDGAFSTATVVVKVNTPPKAVATADTTAGTAPLAVTFNGSASTDADGDTLTYAWDLDADNLFDDSTAVQPIFNYTTPGTYTVTLKVTDTGGAFSTATLAVKVNATPNAVATANVTSGNAPLAVTFSALGSTDPDAGDTLTYAWDLDGDNLLDDSTAAQPTFSYTTPGNHTATLRVTDSKGASSTATVVIKVNTPPAAVATASATSGTAPLGVMFNGSASTDADGDALTYAWDLDGDNLFDAATSAQPTFSYTTPGTYTVTLKVTDPSGAFSTATVVITVQAADPGPGPDIRPPFAPIGHGSYAQGTTPSGLIQGVSVGQSAQAGQPAQATIATASGKADNSRPGATFEMTVHLPAGMARNASSFTTCGLTLLQTQGPSACPAGSAIGAGSAHFDAWPVVPDFVDAQITAFNGIGGSILLYVFPDLGPTMVMEGRPIGGSAFEFAVPPILTVPGAPLAALAGLTLDLQSSGYLTNPPDCPTAGFAWGFDFLYESGERLSLSLRVRCTNGLLTPVTTVSPVSTVSHVSPALSPPPGQEEAICAGIRCLASGHRQALRTGFDE